MNNLQKAIEAAWEDRSKLSEKPTQEAIHHLIGLLDSGQVRVAEPGEDGAWKVNEWVK
ncbi:MAG: 2,3,4,5-tetrahydropyridine-2,6-dicarboxylate N-succinyltransferase, partial [Phaeodactylibacter sp.]|nr:2,3,4,5-tetrahydropyridine-2,6-dicarboxylate N-succinyltransferase [Phaeodactylibacter sp.]